MCQNIGTPLVRVLWGGRNQRERRDNLLFEAGPFGRACSPHLVWPSGFCLLRVSFPRMANQPCRSGLARIALASTRKLQSGIRMKMKKPPPTPANLIALALGHRYLLFSQKESIVRESHWFVTLNHVPCTNPKQSAGRKRLIFSQSRFCALALVSAPSFLPFSRVITDQKRRSRENTFLVPRDLIVTSRK